MRLIVVLTLLVSVALCADLRIDKAQLPLTLDVSSHSLFRAFPGTLCRTEINPKSAFLSAQAISCKAKTEITAVSGPFFNTTCFKLDALAATAAQLKVSCASSDFKLHESQSIRVTVVDAPPKCRNMTVSISKDKGVARFFLRADDPDDNNIFFHVRNASVWSLLGELKYCTGCDVDSPASADNPKNWELYSKLVDDMTLLKYSRMFSYTVDVKLLNSSFHDMLKFSAHDVSGLDCPQDGEVHFVDAPVGQPTLVADSSVTTFLGRPQTFQMTGSSETAPQLNFKIKSVPDPACAVICKVNDAARLSLRDFSAVSLSGAILEPCSEKNALKPEDDITLMSTTKDTFFLQTFVVIKTLKSCATSSFAVVAADQGVESQKQVVEVKTKVIEQRCIPFSRKFKPSESITFTAESFVLSPGPYSVTTLTKGNFELQSAAAKISSMAMTPDSTLVFVGTQNVDVTLMIEATSPPWTGFCTLSFVSTIPTPPPPVNTPPSTSAPTNTPQLQTTASPIGAPIQLHEKPFNYTVLLFFIVVVLIVVYFFRDSFLQFCRKGTGPARRYGVANTEED